MKPLIPLVLLVLSVASALADTSATILVSLRDLGQTVVARRSVSLTPLTPYPRTVATNLILRGIRGTVTDSSGYCIFENVLWGTYRLDVWGVPSSSFVLTLNTNHSGTVSAADLVGAAALFPRNPLSNYYTRAEIDALLAGRIGLTTNFTIQAGDYCATWLSFTNGWLESYENQAVLGQAEPYYTQGAYTGYVLWSAIPGADFYRIYSVSNVFGTNFLIWTTNSTSWRTIITPAAEPIIGAWPDISTNLTWYGMQATLGSTWIIVRPVNECGEGPASPAVLGAVY